uniref:Putative glutamine synthetase n=1 Tax=Streptomyces pristinaespiralis TaxID=38300 RepID=E9N6V9_STRPR|nr:putative glutamine synthetase [Streptomyces pristinaespiralis]
MATAGGVARVMGRSAAGSRGLRRADREDGMSRRGGEHGIAADRECMDGAAVVPGVVVRVSSDGTAPQLLARCDVPAQDVSAEQLHIDPSVLYEKVFSRVSARGLRPYFLAPYEVERAQQAVVSQDDELVLRQGHRIAGVQSNRLVDRFTVSLRELHDALRAGSGLVHGDDQGVRRLPDGTRVVQSPVSPDGAAVLGVHVLEAGCRVLLRTCRQNGCRPADEEGLGSADSSGPLLGSRGRVPCLDGVRGGESQHLLTHVDSAVDSFGHPLLPRNRAPFGIVRVQGCRGLRAGGGVFFVPDQVSETGFGSGAHHIGVISHLLQRSWCDVLTVGGGEVEHTPGVPHADQAVADEKACAHVGRLRVFRSLVSANGCLPQSPPLRL